jgi:hypothetical protein
VGKQVSRKGAKARSKNWRAARETHRRSKLRIVQFSLRLCAFA